MRKNLERILKFAKNVWNDNLQNNGFKNNVQEIFPKRWFENVQQIIWNNLVAKKHNFSQFEKVVCNDNL